MSISETMSGKLSELFKLIGNTPAVEMGDDIFGKLESKNPAGSIKDRAAFFILKKAIEDGALKEGGAFVEATSGNMGIALAFLARELGLKALICMPESMTAERRAMISAYGAELVLTPANLGMNGAVAEAEKIEKALGAFRINQFANPESIEAHYKTTAPEFFSQVEGLKYVVAGVGSGGTAMGFVKYIEENGLDCKVIAVEPKSSPLMSKGYAGAHAIQGIGANFLPELVKPEKFDRIMTVSDEDAIENTKELYKKFGIKCGISSGAAYSAALRLRESVASGKIGIILPDDANRYQLR